jgi:hypothetical protein
VICELEDATFDVDREVLLPGTRDDADAEPNGDRITGLSVMQTTLAFAAEAQGMKLLVAGHTDTTGSDAHNQALSERRAENVYLYLTGQRDAWAQHCLENQETADWQRVLQWTAETHGWDSDPGKVDNKYGPATSGARKRFRETYLEEFGIDLGQGSQSAADWAAYFDLYDAHLAELLEVNAPGLVELRGRLRFTEPAQIGCGELWPNESVGVDGYSCRDNRRVDLLFFEDEDVPPLGDDEVAGESLYGNSRYVSEYLPVDVESAFERVVLHDAVGNPLPNVRWRARVGDAVLEDATTDDNGVASFLKRSLPSRFTLDWAPSPEADLLYHGEHLLDLASGDLEEGVASRLANLGYTHHDDLAENVSDLQLEFNLMPTGNVMDVRDLVVMWHDHGVPPEVEPDFDYPEMEHDEEHDRTHVCGMVEE